MAKAPPMTLEAAETLALQGLAFIASDPPRLSRFLSLTGIDPGELKAWDGNRGLHGAILEYLLGDESLLLVFASEAGCDPQTILPTQALLSGDSIDY